MKKTTRFKELILAPEILLIPAVPDAYTARLAQAAGFDAIARGGITGIEILGQPDVDLETLTELADWTQKIADVVDIPVFADGDTGHGNVTNVVRTVQLFERAGAGGMFIEDQVSPKRCGHTAGKQVIEIAEMAAKLKAATDARIDPDFMIMARVDAIAVNGLEDAIRRGHIFREAGADMLLIEAPEHVDDMKRIVREIDAPHMVEIVLGGKTPVLTPEQLQDIGYSSVVYPAAVAQVLAKTAETFLAALKANPDLKAFADIQMDFGEYFSKAGLDEVRAKEARYTEEGRAVVDEYDEANN